MSGFAQALAETLKHEGGYANHPNDPGGATMRGVTQAVYDAWRRESRRDPKPVREITDVELEAIYHTRYWMTGHCEALPWPLSALHFDACVNHGIARATKILQQAVGADADGVWGPLTAAAVDGCALGTACREYIRHRIDFYEVLWGVRRNGEYQYRVFMGGWIRRALDMWRFAIQQRPEIR